MKQCLFSIAYKQFFVVTSTLNLIESCSTLRSFFRDALISNIVCDKMFETFLNFYHNLRVWYHHIMTNFMIFRLGLSF
jgi:hypothetical protein